MDRRWLLIESRLGTESRPGRLTKLTIPLFPFRDHSQKSNVKSCLMIVCSDLRCLVLYHNLIFLYYFNSWYFLGCVDGRGLDIDPPMVLPLRFLFPFLCSSSKYKRCFSVWPLIKVSFNCCVCNGPRMASVWRREEAPNMIMFLLIIICIFAILKWVFWNPWCIYTSHRHLEISKRICKLFMWIWYSHMQNILFLDPRWSTGICIFCSYVFIVFDMHMFYPCAILGGQMFYFFVIWCF